MSRHVLTLSRRNRDLAMRGVRSAPDGWVLELREPKRSDPQNNALHGLITQIVKQRPHHFNVKMDVDAYKRVFMQALGGELKMMPTLDGDGYFPMGRSTSALVKGEFADLITLILEWCAREGLTIEHFDGAPDGIDPSSPHREVA